MVLFAAGLLVFFAVHTVPMQADLRAGLVKRFGTGTYKGIFSVISAIGLALIVIGYHKINLAGKNPQLWFPPVWARHVALVIMLPALILLVAAYVPSRIRTAAKHPMLAAI